MQNHRQSSGLRVRSTVLLVAIVGNLIFSAVFVLSTGLHVVKAGKQAEQTVQTQQGQVKEQKLVTLAQIN